MFFNEDAERISAARDEAGVSLKAIDMMLIFLRNVVVER